MENDPTETTAKVQDIGFCLTFKIYDKVVYSYTYKNANYIKWVLIFAYQIAYSKILYILFSFYFRVF